MVPKATPEFLFLSSLEFLLESIQCKMHHVVVVQLFRISQVAQAQP